EGERVLLVGASGAGKSTLLQALAGLLDRTGAADEEGELRVRGDAALVLQDPDTQLVMARSGDDVAFGLENRCVPTAEIWPRVHRALADVGFAYSEDRATAALSGGEKQRLAIAGILALRPRVLLLDEPTANLDPDGARAVREVIARVAPCGTASAAARRGAGVRRRAVATPSANARASDRHGFPGPRASARRLPRRRRAPRRPARYRSSRGRGRAARARAHGAARPFKARGRQSLHALRRREAAALGRHRARHDARRARTRRADVRTGPPHLR